MADMERLSDRKLLAIANKWWDEKKARRAIAEAQLAADRKAIAAEKQAGRKEEREKCEAEFKLRYNPDYLKFQDGVAVGRKEVVDYFEHHGLWTADEKQAKLKEWGIEVPKAGAE